MASIGDDYELLKSSEPQGVDDITATGKTWFTAYDMNNGSYSSSNVKFDLSQLSSSDTMCNMREAVIDVPLVIVANSPLNDTFKANACDFMVGLKNGYHCLVHAITTTVAGLQTETRVENMPMFTTFKLLNKFSEAEAEVKGASRGFAKDDNGWTYTAAANVGLVNNRARGVLDVSSASGDSLVNDGLMKRMKRNRFNLNANAGAGRHNVITQAQAISNMENYVSYSADGQTVVYYIMATIHLQDVSSFFGDALPMCRIPPGSTIELSLNTGYFTTAMAAIGGSRAMTITASNWYFGTCPLMITEVDKRTAAAVAYDAGYTAANSLAATNYHIQNYTQPYSWQSNQDAIANITVSLGITKPHQIHAALAGVAYHSISNCRMRVPFYTLEPSIELKYISENKSKVLEWHQLKYFSFQNIGIANQLPNLIASGIQNAVGLLIVPILSVNGHQTVSPIASPFTTEPCTTSPNRLLNFNVAYNGHLVFPENQNYSYAFYENELRESIFVLNGGHDVTGVSSGLIREDDFKNNYGYYYVNLSRRFADSKASGTITLYGVNNTNVAIDIHCFVICKQSALCDVSTGKLTMNMISQ